MNSANAQEWGDVSAALAADQVDVLLVSPERLNNPRFRDELLPGLSPARAWSWSTRRTASATGATTSGPTTGGSATCSPSCRPGTPVLATTATANARVVADVAEQLAVGPAARTRIRRAGQRAPRGAGSGLPAARRAAA